MSGHPKQLFMLNWHLVLSNKKSAVSSVDQDLKFSREDYLYSCLSLNGSEAVQQQSLDKCSSNVDRPRAWPMTNRPTMRVDVYKK